MPHYDLNLLPSFILLLMIAGLTAYYANTKGRNPLLWFIIGILLGIFAPILLFFFPQAKQEGDYPTMSVSNPDPSLEVKTPPKFLEEKKGQEDQLWFYLDENHQQMGPVSIIALRELWNRGSLDLNRYVWTEGMEKWEKVDQLPALIASLNRDV